MTSISDCNTSFRNIGEYTTPIINQLEICAGVNGTRDVGFYVRFWNVQAVVARMIS